MGYYGELGDDELTALLKQGDRKAFAEIYDRYKFVLHNHAWNKIRNKEEAQDTIQDIFSMIWNKRETVEIGNNLSGYLYTCVRNNILNLIARKGIQTKYINSILQFAGTEPIITDYRLRENQLKAIIEREIAQLPPRMREVFELSRKQHLSHKEIAQLMGTTEQTVKKQMTNALKILRIKLGIVIYVLFILNI